MLTPSFVVHATYIRVLFFTHIPFAVNHTFNVMPNKRLKYLQQGWAGLVEMTENERDK